MPEREPFAFAPVPEEQIDPRAHVPPEHLEQQDARHEASDSLSREILQWWRGDTHAHSVSSTRPGFKYFEALHDAAEIGPYYQKLGAEFVVLSEHSSNPKQPELLTPEHPISQSLLQQAEKAPERNKENREFAMLSGVESNIMFDAEGQPRIDVPNEVLEKLDLVIASRHKIEREHDLTAIRSSLLAAAEHPNVDTIGHMDRYIRMPHNWDMFVANMPEIQAFQSERQALEQQKKSVLPEEQERLRAKLKREYYPIIEKVIGKVPMSEEDERDPRITEWRKLFLEMERRYWEVMDEVLDTMQRTNKAFEINFGAMPSPLLVRKAAAKGLPFLLTFDAHDLSQYKWQHTPEQKAAYDSRNRWAKDEMTAEDEAILQQYKIDRLTAGPGVIPILRLVRQLRQLQKLGVTPDQVVNSSRQRMVHFLTETRGKSTRNLELLRGRSKHPAEKPKA
ncbi:MAG: hypothetical protein HY340_04000 [Candidatus Kerfeldbacteria bacterium]|nr:hypothetical protein [Candidatus Kerfeldbacteria bacterium]